MKIGRYHIPLLQFPGKITEVCIWMQERDQRVILGMFENQVAEADKISSRIQVQRGE